MKGISMAQQGDRREDTAGNKRVRVGVGIWRFGGISKFGKEGQIVDVCFMLCWTYVIYSIC